MVTRQLRQRESQALRRATVVAFAMSCLFGGCASMSNTLAQDMAWERWKQCDRFPTVKLKDIKPDGQIWVWTSHGPNLDSWQECDRKARVEQGQRVAAAGSAPPGIVQAPVVAATVFDVSRPPVWHVGDEWAFRWASPQGRGTFIWTVDREEMIEGVSHYVMKSGAREIFYRKADQAYLMDRVGGAVESRATPHSIMLKWPIAVGNEWEETVTRDRPGDRSTNTTTEVCRIDVEESVTIAAGTFRTLKKVCLTKGTGDLVRQVWYSPEVKLFVKEWHKFSYGIRERELIAFKLR